MASGFYSVAEIKKVVSGGELCEVMRMRPMGLMGLM